MFRKATLEDLPAIQAVINDAAEAYRGVIPADRWSEPYMSADELSTQVAEGVDFTCWTEEGQITGVMGIQDRGEVALIRHAYVTTRRRGGGVGTRLLQALTTATDKPILIGTWAAATWAISFYQKHGFSLVPDDEKNALLGKFWSIPARQVETSVVLADHRYSPALAR
jgi:N-acetylglutamate synthase-like GNAT family acetyltransferase